MNRIIKKKKLKQQQEKLDLLIASIPAITNALAEIMPAVIKTVLETAKQMSECFKNIDWKQIAEYEFISASKEYQESNLIITKCEGEGDGANNKTD